MIQYLVVPNDLSHLKKKNNFGISVVLLANSDNKLKGQTTQKVTFQTF